MILDQISELHKIQEKNNRSGNNFLNIYEVNNIKRIREVIGKGKWSVLNYACPEGLINTYGLKILPWISSTNWPAISTTTSMESITDYPSMKVRILGSHIQLLNENRSYCEKFYKNWSLYHETILPVYKLFGGADDLDDLKEIVFDKNNWPSETISENEIIMRNRKYSLKKDSSQANHYIWDLLDKLISNEEFLPDIPNIELKIYEDKVKNMIASRAYVIGEVDDIESIQLHLMQSVLYNHGFDTTGIEPTYLHSVSRTDLNVFDPIGKLLAPFNEESIKEEIKSMPEFHIAKVMNEQNEEYNGIAHMETAAILDEQYNDPQRVWTCLVSAGYWAGKNLPSSQPTIIKAAIHHCEKNNWNEAAEVLKYNLDFLESA